MDDFDDPMLERLLGGGAPLDVDLAYGRVTRRVRQVRRRRVMVAGTAACVVLVAGGAFALNRTDPDTPGLQPAATFDSVDGSTADTDGTATDDTSVDGTATTDATGTSTPEATAPTTAATGGFTPTLRSHFERGESAAAHAPRLITSSCFSAQGAARSIWPQSDISIASAPKGAAKCAPIGRLSAVQCSGSDTAGWPLAL